MHAIHRDYLMTYDPEYIEQHEDSSDFDESCIPIVTPKNGNHSLLKRKKRKSNIRNELLDKNKQGLFIDCDAYPVKLEVDGGDVFTSELKIVDNKSKKRSEVKHTSKKGNTAMNSGDQVEMKASKLSIVKHKLIPCLSNIFKRSNNSTKRMSVIEENHTGTTPRDNCCERCSDCERRRIRKYYKTQNYAVQPVYAIEGNAHEIPAPFGPTKITDKPLQNYNLPTTKNQYSSCCSVSSSSENEAHIAQERRRKVQKFKDILRKEIMKEHWKFQNQQHNFRHQHQQYPSKDHKNSYQVFTTPYHPRNNTPPSSEHQFFNELPTSSSSFWDYLYDKFSRKYQTHRVEMPKPCTCCNSSRIRCAPDTCQELLQNQRNPQEAQPPVNTTCRGREQNISGVACSCKENKQETLRDQYTSGGYCPPPQLSAEESAASMKKKTQEKKVQCKCHEKQKPNKPAAEARRSPASTSSKSSPPLSEVKPCQEGHEEITSSLAQKYNGEILCIHNPPCVLINGCLNLPPQKDQQPMNFWPVTETTNINFGRMKTETANREQSCQYYIQRVNTTPRNECKKAEKNIQSICHHNPPCEIVRGCYKPKYDPNLYNSCVHVPMCEKMPECLAGKRVEGKACEHRPKCPEIPMCSRNLVYLTARDHIGTQVKPKESLVCRHIPPCIMIPKCVGRAVCGSYITLNCLPHCVHQPPCPLIPACCRKLNKEMVSVSSQYPNACRIV